MIAADATRELQLAEADATPEQQLKQTISGSSSRSRRTQGAAAEMNAIGEQFGLAMQN